MKNDRQTDNTLLRKENCDVKPFHGVFHDPKTLKKSTNLRPNACVHISVLFSSFSGDVNGGKPSYVGITLSVAGP